jgi:hypothetical protein
MTSSWRRQSLTKPKRSQLNDPPLREDNVFIVTLIHKRRQPGAARLAPGD